jgi:hypothetical protein
MLRDFNTTKSVYNVCFRNSSAADPEDQSDFRSPVVTWTWPLFTDTPVLLVPQTPTPNTRELLIGISVDGDTIVSIRKYFSAGSAFVTETFALIGSGTHTLKSTTLLDSVEVWFVPDNPIALTPPLNAYASISCRP